MRKLIVAACFVACQSASSPNGTLVVDGGLLTVVGADEPVLFKDIVSGTVPIIGELTGVAGTVTTMIELVDATAPTVVLDSVQLTGTGSFSLNWIVPLGEDKKAHVLEVHGARSDAGELNRVQVTRRVDTLLPTLQLSLRPSLTVVGQIDATFSAAGEIDKLAIAASGGTALPLALDATTLQVGSLPVGVRTALTLTATGKNGAVASQTAEAAAGVVFVDSSSTHLQPTGSLQAPYRSASSALAAVTDATIPFIVHLAAGTYSKATGEIFPLVVKSQRTLEGEAGPSGPISVITGAAMKTVELNAGVFEVCLTAMTPTTATTQVVKLRDVALVADSTDCDDGPNKIPGGFVGINSLATISRATFSGYSASIIFTGRDVCTESTVSSVTINGQRNGLTGGAISIDGQARAAIIDSTLNDVDLGIKFDTDSTVGGSGNCNNDGSSVAGTEIFTASVGISINTDITTSVGSSNAGRRTRIELHDTQLQNITTSERVGGILVRNKNGAHTNICDTDVTVRGATGQLTVTEEFWPAAIFSESGEMRFATAAGSAQCGQGGVTRVTVEDPRAHGLLARSDSYFSADRLVMHQTASDFTSFKSSGVLLVTATGSERSLSRSTVTGFSRNLSVISGSPISLVVKDVCVDTGVWDDGTGQGVTLVGSGAFVPSGPLSYATLGNALPAGANANYALGNANNAISGGAISPGAVCTQ